MPLAPILQAAIDTARPLIERKGHRLSASIPTDEIVISADEHRLTQLFGNLLNNAARYTPEGGTIEVRATRAGGCVEVAIADNGVGVEAQMRERIFDMFVRGRPVKAADSGLGVGLALSRRIAELHDGSIDVQSEGAGKGACFTVRLPLSQSTAARTPMSEPTASGRRRVLVVDDNEDAGRALDLMLRDLGHEPLVVSGGVEALEQLVHFDPHVVLADLGMPGMDGFELVRRIRTSSLTRQPTVVAVTGWGQEGDRQRTEAVGFDAHLVKPVVPEALARTIANAEQD